MLISYNWLKEYVNIKISPSELADRITKSGIEVEMVESLNKGISGVVVGYVQECIQHPNADKLRVCKVDIGQGEVSQIVCGAPNVAQGQKVAVAVPGAVLPGNFKIKKAKLRGEESHGMICSLQELGVDTKLVPKEYATGIFVMPSDAEPGSDALEFLNLNDHVLELGLTPNRADCLNVIGVAYEVAAILEEEVKLPNTSITTTEEKAEDFISVSIESFEDNPYYGAMIIRDVKIGHSPLWMQNRLMASGIRPINNIVDITNYVLLEYGQPLHAFDYNRLGSKEIVVRRAAEGEHIQTLDDQDRTLKDTHLVITNGTDPIAVAGVMGGATSEVQSDTTNVLLEAAYFASGRVRTASKDLGLRSEASSRYEKGIDRNRVFAAAMRAAGLMAELAGGKVAEGIVEAGKREVNTYSVKMDVSRMNGLLGTNITAEQTGVVFNRLGFSYKETDGHFEVVVPSRRPDITIEADLIEEVGRIYGYDRIPTTYLLSEARPGGLTENQAKRRNIRNYLEGAGLYQAVTYALTTPAKSAHFSFSGEEVYPISVAHPMSEERSTLRMSLLPQLLEVLQYNRNRSMEDLAIYEMGSVFINRQEVLTDLPEEYVFVSGAVTGVFNEHLWQGERKTVDFFVLKGILEGLLDELNLSERITYEAGEIENMHPGRTAIVKLDGISVGFVGQLHPALQKELDLKDTYVFELNATSLLEKETDQMVYQTLPRYPSITRDIALVVDQELPAGDLTTVIQAAGGVLLKEVNLFDLYEGEKMEEGKKSLAFSLKYFDPERTLTDEEVVTAHDRVLKSLEERFGAQLRK
ncbi:phenylalanine--tRNA ligase subunit beta [Fictibacillus barbaricus]|uniref:Phenylalanine--tRNA ligase beta subunit n=1 Tax=Fictibacillus barbaricus TaxID=182136 RepID=A0ABS2ZHH4_9BACL|nr:phenylalanine--tRNA ligase subunit beta [Fictibacillus barbaricus]MBN3547395.1 phenylalanine--tRNA ligase subunit beta [Fictibacillus barbaricus]GGB48673.1 phenylalanine--tRNA ligase beta subunit [Fictibacillus barbaricus]